MSAAARESASRVLWVVALVSLCCALLVSSAATLLQPRIAANLEARRAARIQAIVAGVPGLADLVAASAADALSAELVELDSGCVVTPGDGELDDWRAAVSDEMRSIAIPPALDLARLQRRPLRAPVYRLATGGRLALLVLPVYGKGYQSTIFAYLGLDPDLSTVAAFSVVEQAETPGLGARIEDPAWQAGWIGKQLVDADGTPVIQVVKGGAEGAAQVDGITGATRTSRGVESMVHYWLGEHGFGPYLAHLRRGTPC